MAVSKSDLVKEVAQKAGVTQKVAGEIVNAFLEILKNRLAKGETIRLADFGTFYVSERKERRGKNPRTGEAITIPACRIPKFKPYRQLKEAVKIPVE